MKEEPEKHLQGSQQLPNLPQVCCSEFTLISAFLLFVNVAANLPFCSPGHTGSSNWESGENSYGTDKNFSLTNSEIEADLSLVCVIHLGSKLFRHLFLECCMNTTTTWVGWHGSREDALFYWLTWLGWSTKMGQKEKANKDEISFIFLHLPFPIESTYIMNVFRDCAFAIWKFRALTIWFWKRFYLDICRNSPFSHL